MLRRTNHVLRARPWNQPGIKPPGSPLLYRCYLPHTDSTTKTKVSDPLRILFCGSDDFSGASLRALHDEHQNNPALIESIDVVVRPGKPTGRGYKVISEPPIKSLATGLGLPVHERDTFTGWDMPEATNLIVAVSFGLFVPPRLLHAAKYGGLNVHPSLLPSYRGPAPLHHTLLDGVQQTGVTLQTLDDQEFDRGLVLARSILIWENGNRRIPGDCTVKQLQDAFAPLGANLLVESLRQGLHVPPLMNLLYRDRSIKITKNHPHAPKITTWDRQVSPGQIKVKTLTRRQRIIGPLWFKAKDPGGVVRRILIEQADFVDCSDKTKWVTPGLGEISARPRRYGKWVYRNIFRIYEPAPAPIDKHAPFTAPPPPTPAEPEDQSLYYWTQEGDDAIYISPYNPPNEQTVAYARIPLLKVEGATAKPAAQVAAAFSKVARLSTLAWERSTRIGHRIDYDLHVASELEYLARATEAFHLFGHRPARLASHACFSLTKLIEDYNRILELIVRHWNPGNLRDKSFFVRRGQERGRGQRLWTGFQSQPQLPGPGQRDLRQPGARNPDPVQPGPHQPALRQPGVEQPDVEQPDVKQSDAEQPDTRKPGAWDKLSSFFDKFKSARKD